MTDFLLELLSEEIPARMQEKAVADLQRLFEGEIAKAGLKAGGIEPFVTPRRLALLVHGLPETTNAVSEELKGPRADAPPQALAGFLGKTGLTREQLVERTDAKGNAVLFAVIEKPGRPTADVLAEAIPAIVRAFPWPKSMRWGKASQTTESLRWVRPLQGIVALLGDTVVPCEVDGIASGRTTAGHRFLHSGPVTIPSPAAYAATLRAAHVIADHRERRLIVREEAEEAAAVAGYTLVEDEGLVHENAGLTEWPVPLLGAFDPAFLEVPREVIQLTMRTNQKYFACVDGDGRLAPAFVCTANIVASDGGAAIVAGNGKVLAARLADARFFWEQDRKVPLEEQAKKLDRILFHEKLGTVADKVERVAKLARWLVEEGIVGARSPLRGEGRGEGERGEAERDPQPSATLTQPSPSRERASLAAMAEQAARLCKADLVTGMVGEFPELQGVMGGYYARAEGLPDEVADAIRDHYKPVGQGDEVPTAPVTVAVSLADKLDTLLSFYLIDERPTGSRDPFALRRAANGVIATIIGGGIRMPLRKAIFQAADPHADGQISAKLETVNVVLAPIFDLVGDIPKELFDKLLAAAQDNIKNPTEGLASVFKTAFVRLLDFFADRLKVQQREAGVRHDLIDAVFALGGEDDLVRLLVRVKALQQFVETEDGANLIAGYRRAANILRAEAKKDGRAPAPFAGFSYAPDAAEAALADALAEQLPKAESAIAQEQYEDAMTALSVMRGPIDRFFEEVTVNSQDETQRSARLGLLDNFRAAMHKVADFSKIEG